VTGFAGPDGGRWGERIVRCPSLDSVPVAVLVLNAEEFVVRRSAQYVSMGRRRPLAIQWQRKGLMPAPGENRRLTREKIPWARDSLCLRWWVEVRVGVN